MCMIYICDTGVPSEENLAAALRRNSDGIGVGWVSERTGEGDAQVATELGWVKGLSKLEELYNLIDDLPFPFVIHFRATSSGLTTEELTQPFPMDEGVKLALSGRTKKGLLFQNGTWKDWARDLKAAAFGQGRRIEYDPYWNDARAIAWLGNYYGEGIFHPLLEDCSNPMRLVTMYTGRSPIIFRWGPETNFSNTPAAWYDTGLGYWRSTYISPAYQSTGFVHLGSGSSQWDPDLEEYVPPDWWVKQQEAAKSGNTSPSPPIRFWTDAELLQVMAELAYGREENIIVAPR